MARSNRSRLGLLVSITLLMSALIILSGRSSDPPVSDNAQVFTGDDMALDKLASSTGSVLIEPRAAENNSFGAKSRVRSGSPKVKAKTNPARRAEIAAENEPAEPMAEIETSKPGQTTPVETTEIEDIPARVRDSKSIQAKSKKIKDGKIKRFDQPAEAMAFHLRKRLPAGEKELPVERYFEAKEKIKQMQQYSTTQNRVLPPLAKTDAERTNSPQSPDFTWSNLGPGNIGGRTRALVIDPGNANIMYAAAVAGGIWKTTNGGTSWAPLDDFMANLAVSSLAMDPDNSQILYAGTGEGFFNFDSVRGAGIFVTTNGGTTWTRLASTNNADFNYVNDVVISPADSTHIYAATRTGVWRSIDGGASWTSQINGSPVNGCTDLVMRNDQATDYVLASCGTFAQATVYRNIDAGGVGVWSPVLTAAGMGRTSLAIAPSNQLTMYALSASIAIGTYQDGLFRVSRSLDGGATWATRVDNANPSKLNTLLLTNPVYAYPECVGPSNDGFFNQGWYDNVIAVDPADENRVWAGGIDLFRSDDGGANWGIGSYWWSAPAPEYAHADNHAIVFHPGYNGVANQTMFVASDGGVFKTNNATAALGTTIANVCGTVVAGMVTWSDLNNGYQVSQFYHGVPYPTGTTYFGGFQDNGTNRGTDAGGPNGWTGLLGGDGGYVAIDDLGDVNPANDVLFGEYTGLSIQKSTNGGVSFFDAVTGISGDSGFAFIAPFTMNSGNKQHLWSGGWYVWRTTNQAASWTRASAITPGDGNVSAIAAAPTDTNKVLFGMSDGYIGFNTAALAATPVTTWSSTRPRTAFVSSLAFDPTNSNIAYATYSTFSGMSVYKSSNSGATWTALPGTGANTLPTLPAHSIVVNPANGLNLYVGTDLGVFVSIDGGVNWLKEASFPNVITESLAFNTVGAVTSVFAFTHGRSAYRANVTANTAPTVTAAVGVTRQQGSPAANSQIATVSDPDQAANTLTVTSAPLTGSGVTVTGISIDGSGNVTANVAASCTAINSTFTLTVTDNASGTATATLTVTVTANTPPVVTYSNPPAVVFGQSGITVNPSAPPTDNGTITGYTIFSVVPPLSTLPTVNGSGVVSINSAGPVGGHVVTVRSTDNCGTTTDSQFTLTVNKAGTSTALSSSGSPSVFGQPVTFTATVSPNAPGAGSPTGNVTFKDGGVNIGSCVAQVVGANVATCSISTLAVGTHPITAVYNGDGNFNINTSSPANQLVNKAGTTTTLSSSGSPSVFGQPVTFTATVNPTAPGAGSPTGNVTFKDGAVNIGSCVAQVVGANVATCSISTLAVGTHPITAVYNGDGNFNGSTSSPANQLVNKAGTTTTLSSSGSPSVFGQPVTFTATVNPTAPGAGSPTGNVTFKDGGVNIGSCVTQVVVANVATCSISTLAVGTHAITAVYNGDGNFNGSTSSPANQLVNKADTATGVQTAVNPPVYGQALVITATVVAGAPGTGIPQGSVNFTDGANPIATCQGVMLNASGAATCTVNNLGAGVNKVIGASYLGNPSYNPSVGSTMQTINPAPLTVLASSHTVTYGDAAPTITSAITGFVLGETAAVLTAQPTCSTTYTAGSAVSLSPYPTSCTGAAAANYSFTYVNGTVLVNKKALTVTADDKTRAYGAANPPLTATFTGFVNGETLPTSGVTGAPSLATATQFSPVSGSPYPITAALGTLTAANYSFTLVDGTLTVNKAVLTITAEDKTRVFGAPNPVLTFLITGFANGETFVTSGVAGAPSVTTAATQVIPVGSYPIAAALGALTSANYSFTFVPGTLTVTQAATTTTITNAAALAATPTTIGQAYAVNWQTSPVAPSTGVPTGTVTVTDGTDTCTAAVGALTCNLTSTTFGPKNITATYGGDSNMTGSTSAAVSHAVHIGITGNVKQFGTNANLAGVTITLSGSAAGVTVTDANGNYGFAVPVLGGSYVLTPSGLSKTYEPILRSYTNVTANITNADFTAYDILGAGANPRHVRVQNTVTTGGEAAVVPIMMVSRGNEVKIAFSLTYDMAVMGTPTVACGYDTAGCSLTVNTSQPGRLGITLTPAAVLIPGLKEIVKVTFQTVPNTLTSTPVSFDDIPTVRDIRNAENNPLPAIYGTGFVTFTQNSLGLEGDVVDPNGNPAGGDGVKANDVTVISQRVTSPNTTQPFATTPNQFQRADVNVPCGNGGIDAGDVTVITQLALGIIAPIGACGPATPTGSTSRPEDSEGTARIIRAVNTTAVAGGTVTVSFVLVSQGNEASASYSVTFPQGTLTNPQVAAGSGVPSGTTVLTNSEAAQGRIGVLIATPNSYTAGTRQMITITFNVSAQATAGTYPIGFSSTPVGQNVSAAAGGALLPTTYEPGNVVIGPTAAGVEVSGKVQTADGRGLRNAMVTITDAKGNRQTATTGSFGNYRFVDVKGGESYVVAVAYRRYRFSSRIVNVTDTLTDVDIVAQE